MVTSSGSVFGCGRAKSGQLGLLTQAAIRTSITSPIKRRRASIAANPQFLTQLVNMGFDESQAEAALVETLYGRSALIQCLCRSKHGIRV